MNIELFPAEKACEQGCPTCPLARRNEGMLPEQIHPEVQETFSILENVLAENSTSYKMHYTSKLGIFPELKHPGLIHSARFETAKSIRDGNNTQLFSSDLSALLRDRSLKVKSVGFSLVPSSPLISKDDSLIIEEIVHSLSQWHFMEAYKEIDVTVRSNMIPLAQFNEVLPHLFKTDRTHLGRIVRAQTICYHNRHKVSVGKFSDSHFYQNLYSGMSRTRKLTIGNRVIAIVKNAKTEKELREAVMSFYPRSKVDTSVAIAPKGVMLVHSSITINNPLFWLSHNDFRTALLHHSTKPDFHIMRFIQDLMKQNSVMHAVALEEQKRQQEKISNAEWMALFEAWRPLVEKATRKPLPK